MLRFIKGIIKKVLKFFIPKSLWKVLNTLRRMSSQMDYVKKSLDNIERTVRIARHEANQQISFIYTKLSSLQDYKTLYYGVDISEIPLKIPFFIPEFPRGIVANTVADTGQFYEQNLLEDVDPYIPKDAVIFDIGANIGNHTLYWGIIRKASQIFSFEPTKIAFSALQKNVQLNDLKGRVVTFNIGLGSQKQETEIAFAPFGGSGATRLKYPSALVKAERESEELSKDIAKHSTVFVDTLDNIIKEMNPPLSCIDFIKIDVEGFEIFTLKGASDTLVKYTPSIFIETTPENYGKVCDVLGGYGYVLVKKFIYDNYLFIHKTKVSKYQ